MIGWELHASGLKIQPMLHSLALRHGGKNEYGVGKELYFIFVTNLGEGVE